MNYKLFLHVILFLMLFTGSTFPQNSDKPTVYITTSSVIQIPADNIFFSITLSVQNEDAIKTYEDHKILEKELLNVFNEFEFADTNISYSLLSIRKQSPFSQEKNKYVTRQIVSLILSDYAKYEPLQLALLSIGINQYQAKFTAEGKEEWIKMGIEETLSKATTEAEITAWNIGKKLGAITEIETSHHFPSNSDGMALAVSGIVSGESLIELPRFVQMRVSVRVRFLLEEN